MTAADVTSKRVESHPNQGTKQVILIASGTIAGGVDYVTLDLASYGISTVLSVREYVHETDYSVIVPTEPESTEVSSGELKVVVADHSTPGDWDDKMRVIVVKGL